MQIGSLLLEIRCSEIQVLQIVVLNTDIYCLFVCLFVYVTVMYLVILLSCNK